MENSRQSSSSQLPKPPNKQSAIPSTTQKSPGCTTNSFSFGTTQPWTPRRGVLSPSLWLNFGKAPEGSGVKSRPCVRICEPGGKGLLQFLLGWFDCAVAKSTCNRWKMGLPGCLFHRQNMTWTRQPVRSPAVSRIGCSMTEWLYGTTCPTSTLLGAVIYILLLLYMFMGVGTVADCFMNVWASKISRIDSYILQSTRSHASVNLWYFLWPSFDSQTCSGCVPLRP